MNSKGEPDAKSRKRRSVRISGNTEDGRSVITGVFQMMSSTTGLPLEMLLDLIEKNGMIVDWLDFYDQAMREGWKVKTIRNRIETSVGDVFGTAHKEEVMKRLDFCLKHRGP